MAAPFGLSGTERLTSFSSLPASPVHVGLAGELHIGSPLMAELSGRSARKIGKAAIHRSLSSWQSSTQKQLDEKE